MNVGDGSMEALVLQSVNDVREQRGVPLSEEPTGETVLFAPGGKLDAEGLINLWILLEQRISDELGAEIVLGTERALSQKHNPFRIVAALTGYISQLLDEQKHV